MLKSYSLAKQSDSEKCLRVKGPILLMPTIALVASREMRASQISDSRIVISI